MLKLTSTDQSHLMEHQHYHGNFFLAAREIMLNYLVAAVANGAWILSREFLTTSAARGGLLTERKFQFDFTKQPDYKMKMMQHKMATVVGLTQSRKFSAAASMIVAKQPQGTI